MSALGHYLEAEGLPTTQISLVRMHTEVIQPPRALWVPFELGRPFGTRCEAAFQRRVISAALALFESESGPVMKDFPEDAPGEA
ncbi:MAG: selenoprotein B, partial [Pseudomonadota bacterium]|nr:selenoprotein B [Pseudomonadota bacterium]